MSTNQKQGSYKTKHMDERFKQLRENGILHSLTDKQIDICLSKCVINDESAVDKFLVSTKAPCRQLGKLICNCVYRSVITVAVALIVFSTLLYNDDFKAGALRFGGRHFYHVMRIVRLASLPLITTIPLSGYHDDLCLIDNPYYEHAVFGAACSICQQTSSWEAFQSIDPIIFKQSYLIPMRCFQIKNTNYSVSYDHLRGQYHKNLQLVNSGLNTIVSNHDKISELPHLMNDKTTEDILSHETFHLMWVSRRVGPSRFFSKMFPKPDFLPEDKEMSLEKIILVDSHKSKAYDLPRGSTENMLYIQASGKRVLNFRPLSFCEKPEKLCKSFTVPLSAGDIVYMHRPIWEIESAPVDQNNQQELGLSFITTF